MNQGNHVILEAMNPAKAIAGIATAGAAVPGAVEALSNAERVILGAPQSVLSVAIAGTLIGVLLLSEKDANRITPDDNLTGHWPRLVQMSKRLLVLAVTVGAFALAAAWLALLAGHLIPSLQGAPQLPLAGIAGVSIRRLLPKWMKHIEKKTTPEEKDHA